MSKLPVIGRVRSSTDGRKQYAICQADGFLTCSCMGWRFQKAAPADRCCKHIVEYRRMKRSRARKSA